MKKMIIISLAFCLIAYQAELNGQNAIESSATAIKKEEKTAIIAGEQDVIQPKNTVDLKTFWFNEFDSLGVIHNAALDYAFGRMRNMNLAGLTNSTMPDIVADLTAEFFTDRYGGIYDFTQDDLKKEILEVGLTPLPPVSQNVSDQLRGTLNSIRAALEEITENETADDFAIRVRGITEASLTGLSENEQMYLKGYADVLTKSFDYWDRNAYTWVDQFSNVRSIAKGAKEFSGNEISYTEGTNPLVFTGMFFESSPDMITLSGHEIRSSGNLQKRHPCAQAIINSDGSGLFSGLVRGCIAGVLFGAGVGCIPAAIFWGGVQAVSASLGAGIACLITQH